MTEKLIQKALLRLFSSHKYVFTNVYFFRNESDFLSFLQSGFCYECEIKISRSDFKADFKKEKHNVHKCNEFGSGFYLRKTNDTATWDPSWDFCRQFPELITAEEYIGSGRINGQWEEVIKIRLKAKIASGVEFISQENSQLPNKFFYVVPTGLIKKEEVPEYAGLIYVDELGRCEKIKDGKFLHKDKLKVTKLFDKMYYSYERELIQKLK